MAVNLYNKRTKKSGIFLFPLLGISGYSKFPHERTYFICEEKKIDEKSRKLIVSYIADKSREFIDFERRVLSGSIKFFDFFQHNDFYYYVFDMSFMNKDWDLFLDGKYSRLSEPAKKKIIAYQTTEEKGIKVENRLIKEILYPTQPTVAMEGSQTIEFADSFAKYAPSLGISPEIMRGIGEIYSKPDYRKETLILE